MALTETIETTRVHLVAGPAGPSMAPLIARPCWALHHTISEVGLIAGRPVPRPGEVLQAHSWMLLLEAQSEFRRHVLEVLRQALEVGIVMITRAPLPHPLEEIDTVHTVVSSRYMPDVPSKFLE
jgi:magnesium chelatase family protein